MDTWPNVPRVSIGSVVSGRKAGTYHAEISDSPAAVPTSSLNVGGPADSTALLGQDANSNGEQAYGSNIDWPSAASYTPPEATALWVSSNHRGDDIRLRHGHRCGFLYHCKPRRIRLTRR